MKRIFGLATVLVTLAMGTNALAQWTFSNGCVVVYRIGDGTQPVTNLGQTVFLDEYRTNDLFANAGGFGFTNPVHSYPMPINWVGGQAPLIADGRALGEGQLSLSADGRFLVLTGFGATLTPGTTPTYQIANGSLSSPTATEVPRVVGLVDGCGHIDTSTVQTNANEDGDDIRAAASLDGTNIWLVGSANGVKYTTRGSMLSTQVCSDTSLSPLRAVNIYDNTNTLYIDTATEVARATNTSGGVNPFGGSLPVSWVATNFVPLAEVGPTSAYGFVMFNLANANQGGALPDTLYVADSLTNFPGESPGAGGAVLKYCYVSGSWVWEGAIGAAAAYAVAGYKNGANVNLVITGWANNTLYTYTDVGAYDSYVYYYYSALSQPAYVPSGGNFSLINVRGIAVVPQGGDTGTISGPGSISVGPPYGAYFSGPAGCPFTPSNFVYSVANLGTSTVSWAASVDANWLTLSPTNGSLASGASTNVIVSLVSSVATNLEGGSDYTNTITFANTTNHVGDTTRLAILAICPGIINQPQSLWVCSGTTAVFSVTASGGALTYQWQKNGTPLTNDSHVSGSTSSTLTLSNTTTNDAGNYGVNISNASCSVTSSGATLTVDVSPPVITSQPTNWMVGCSGGRAVFSVTASGSAPFAYQWQKNGTPLTNDSHVSGSTNSMLTINPTTINDAGNYTVIISNACGGVTSSNAMLTVLSPPVITSQPQSLGVCSGNLACFTMAASGTTPLVYQWQKNGSNLTDVGTISGSASSTLCLGTTTTNDDGSYRVIISNVCGSVTSSNATLTVLSPPVITSQPQSVTVFCGNLAAFSVTASGSALTYQWQKNGTTLPNGGNVSGSTNSTLILYPTTINDAGNYRVIISNACGSVTSTSAALTVVAPCSQQQVYAGTSGDLNGKVYVYQGGTNWTAISGTLGDAVLDIIQFNGTLYAATKSTNYVGEVWRYDGGTNWTVVGTNMDDAVCDLEIYSGQLYAGTAYNDGNLYRYDAISTNFDYVGSVSDFTGIRAMYSSSYGYLQLGDIESDVFGHYDGTNLYFDSDLSRSCVVDFAEYNNQLYAATEENADLLGSTNGINWSDVFDYNDAYALWKLQPFQGQLYLGYGNRSLPYGQLAYMDSSNVWHGVLTVSDSIISMVAGRHTMLYFGIGAEAVGDATGSGPGYVYAYTGNGATNATLISGPMGDGVQCLYVVECNPPTASFTATPTNGPAPLTVQFTDASTTPSGTITTRNWTFGDSGTSTLQSPNNVYASSGTYTASLVVANSCGVGSTNTATATISVYDPYQWWRLEYFGSTNSANGAPGVDADGTGMSNTNKFLAGFNPTNPAAYLHVISIAETGTDINVTYLGANGDTNWWPCIAPCIASRTNVLEFTAGATDGSYSNNFESTGQTNVLSGGNGLGTVTNMVDPGGATNTPSRYYRVRVLLP